MTKELKKILNTMSNIKGYCDERIGCEGCPFQIVEKNMVYGEIKEYCQIQKLAHELFHCPCAWDIDEIADIMNR